jgi:hypothetical protein
MLIGLDPKLGLCLVIKEKEMDLEELVDFFLFHNLTPRNYRGKVPSETPVHEINYRIALKEMYEEWKSAQNEDEE